VPKLIQKIKDLEEQQKNLEWLLYETEKQLSEQALSLDELHKNFQRQLKNKNVYNGPLWDGVEKSNRDIIELALNQGDLPLSYRTLSYASL